jgi:biopolymer transport protein ExbD
MSSATANEEGEFGFQIAPMVDVVFVLLLFFMACAGQTITEGLLKIATPSPGTPRIVSQLILEIDAAGNVSANGLAQSTGVAEHELPGLQTYLKSVMGAEPEMPVVIAPVAETRHERVIDVLNSCRQAKVKNISFR